MSDEVCTGCLNEAQQERDAWREMYQSAEATLATMRSDANLAREAVAAVHEDLRKAEKRIASIKATQAACRHVCTVCHAEMQRWQDFEEFQHADCGGLVRLRAEEERDSALADASRLRAENDQLKRDRAEVTHRLKNMLAVIHRDGGHHTDAVGIEQSCNDAHEEWSKLKREIDSAWSSHNFVAERERQIVKNLANTDEEYLRIKPVYEAAKRFREVCKGFGDGPIVYADYYDAIHALNGAIDTALASKNGDGE